MRLIADWLPHHHFTRGKGKRDAVVSLALTTPSPASSTPLRSPVSLYFIPVIPVKNRALSEHEVCVLEFDETRRPSNDEPLFTTNNKTLTNTSSPPPPLRSNMSSANRGVGPSSRSNKRARDDDDLPSSAAHPPSSRECDKNMRHNNG